MKSILALVGALATIADSKTYFKETFDDNSWENRWVQSSWKPDMGKFTLSSGNRWKVNPQIEQGIMTGQAAKFYALSAPLDETFSNKGENLVVQFSVKNSEKESSGFCGGGYIKLLPSSTDLKKFGGDSPYYIMFGPDICGYDVSRIHLIFNYDDENLLKNEEIKLDYDEKDDKTHLYTLVVKPDNTYEVFFDQKTKAGGNLHDQWHFPQKEIPDPADKKPASWVDNAVIIDPQDKKPEGWDDITEFIADPNAVKPDDWDEEDDGVWEAPKLKNPEYKGVWVPKEIPNPDYQGPWVQKKIPNPDYKEDVYVYNDIGVVGFELWIVNQGSIFDNIYVGNSLEEANALAESTWKKISAKETKVKEEWEKKNKKDEPKPKMDDDDDSDSTPEDLDDIPVKDDL